MGLAATVLATPLARRPELRFLLGASPSAASKVARDVTNFFVPAVSKSTTVRSSPSSTIVPFPYLACRMYCPVLKAIGFLSADGGIDGLSDRLPAAESSHRAPLELP